MDDESDMDSDQEEYQQMVWSRTFTINYRIIPKEVKFCTVFQFTKFYLVSNFKKERRRFYKISIC